IYLIKTKNLRKLELIIPYILPSILLIMIPLYFLRILSVNSIIARLEHWIHDLNVDFNFLLGGAIGEIGSAVRGDGFIATLDSYWLLMLMSVGALGIITIFLYFIIITHN